MSFRFAVLETSLNRAEFRWKGLRLLQHSAVLGIALCLFALALGSAIHFGVIENKALAILLFTLLAAVAVIAWAVIIITVLVNSPDRQWLAAAVERTDRRFLDRLNTLLFLERRRNEARSHAFAVRIARQAQRVIVEERPPTPFKARRSLAFVFAFAVMLAATLLLNHYYAPWDKLVTSQKATRGQLPPADKPLELAAPTTNNVEQNLAWGEVRITDPGNDLKVTKVDVVPLQIEASANQALNKVGWFSTVNGAGETPHELPAPAEPRYAVYQPSLYLDELQLADWDVLTYYAKASTTKPDSYASEVYFLEVRPFREDILKMPGGENGQAYQQLNEMSSLITRQQHVIRQTHQHMQQPPPQQNLEAQDRRKLADAEGDLGQSVQHLYAKMAAGMENKPIGEALDNLAKAQKSLGGASKSLQDDVMDDAQNRERRALTELVAARKMYQKAVGDNPDAFADKQEEQEEGPKTAEPSRKLSEMAEFRNESKVAQDFVKKTLEEQRRVERQSRSAQRGELPKLATQEQQLQKDLENFEGQHPRAFKGAEAQAQQSQDALRKAAEALQRRSSNDSRTATQEASKQLEQLGNAMQGHASEQQLTDAYHLKQILDQQIRKFDKAAKPDSQASSDSLRQNASDARETIDQLKKSAEQEPTRDAFGQQLRDALSGQNKMDLDMKLARLERARTLDQAQDESQQQRAQDASQALSKVSKAFDESQPKAMQAARKGDSLKPSPEDAFGQGMAELDSLVRQAENNKKLKPEDQAKQGREAMQNLREGMKSQFGDSEEGQTILAQLDRVLKDAKLLEVDDIKKLMDQLQHFSVENSEKLAKKDGPEMTNIDPSRLPPAYRGRIQKYFQKLSEK